MQSQWENFKSRLDANVGFNFQRYIRGIILPPLRQKKKTNQPPYVLHPSNVYLQFFGSIYCTDGD